MKALIREFYEHSRARILEDKVSLRFIQTIEAEELLMRDCAMPQLTYQSLKAYYENGNRLSYESLYFTRRKYLLIYGLLSWLKEDIRYIQQLEEILFEICHEYSWSLPAHMAIDEPITVDLFAAETAQTLAEITFLLQDRLSEFILQLCYKSIRNRVINPFLNRKEPLNWELMSNNWNAVCAGSIGIAGLYILNEQESLQLYETLIPTLERFIQSFEKDGTCLEGLSYWTYGMSYYAGYGHLLKIFSQGKINLFEDKHLVEIAKFQQKCYLGSGLTVSFSDGNRYDTYRRGLTKLLQTQVEGVYIPESASPAGLHDDHCYRWLANSRDLVFGVLEEPLKISDSHSGEMLSAGIIFESDCHLLPEAGWLICPGHNTTYALVAKGGHNDEPHNHNDIGQFCVIKNGHDFLPDLGAGEYTREYFNEKRYEVFCNRSISHSVPIIDGYEQDTGRQAYGELLELSERHIAIEMSHAYPKTSIKRLLRNLWMNPESGIDLVDKYELKKNEKVTVTERFISYDQPVVEDDKVLLTYKSTDLSIICQQNGKVTVTSHIHRNHQGTEEKVYTIDYVFELTESTEISFIFQ